MSEKINDMLEDIIDFENEMVERMDKGIPLYKKFRDKFMTGMRVGLEVLDDNGGVLAGYTLVLGEPYLESYEEGVNDVFMTEGVKKYVLEEMMDDKEKFKKRPWKTSAKYMFKMPKYLLDGAIKLNFKKK